MNKDKNTVVHTRIRETVFVILSGISVLLYSYIIALFGDIMLKSIYSFLKIDGADNSVLLLWCISYIGMSIIWLRIQPTKRRAVKSSDTEQGDIDEEIDRFISELKDKEFANAVRGRHFNSRQLKEIIEGIDKGIDIDGYCNEKLTAEQMKEIREGLAVGVDISFYNSPKYEVSQMKVIRDGLIMGLDVSYYANPKFNAFQMYQIMKGLMQGIDVSKYAKANISWEEMEDVRISLACALIKERDG